MRGRLLDVRSMSDRVAGRELVLQGWRRVCEVEGHDDRVEWEEGEGKIWSEGGWMCTEKFFRAFTSAPKSRRSSHISTCPCVAAHMRGVQPWAAVS